MEHQKENNGFQTFLEHWGFLVIVAMASISSWFVLFLTKLRGTAWICCFGGAVAVMVFGTALIGFAKTRFRLGDRFWIIRIQSGPEHLVGHFRWGWRLFLCGAVLAFFLLLS